MACILDITYLYLIYGILRGKSVPISILLQIATEVIIDGPLPKYFYLLIKKKSFQGQKPPQSQTREMGFCINFNCMMANTGEVKFYCNLTRV